MTLEAAFPARCASDPVQLASAPTVLPDSASPLSAAWPFALGEPTREPEGPDAISDSLDAELDPGSLLSPTCMHLAAITMATEWSVPLQLRLTPAEPIEEDELCDRGLDADPLTMHMSAYQPRGHALFIGPVVRENPASVDAISPNFGRHIRSLRLARGMTQDMLADRSALSADTIRRLEHGNFSPSLETVRKLCNGLDLKMSTLFESYELGGRNEVRELVDLLSTRSPRELVMANRVLRSFFLELDVLVHGFDPLETFEHEPDARQ